jgi:hypothetical protein
LTAAEQFGGEQWDGQFVMACDGEAASRAVCGRASDDVREWAIRLNKIEVGRRQVRERVAQITH